MLGFWCRVFLKDNLQEGFIRSISIVVHPEHDIKLLILLTTTNKGKQMSIQGYTYQIGDLFTTSKTGVTGRIASFTPMSKNVTRVALRLANGQQRFAMVKTSK